VVDVTGPYGATALIAVVIIPPLQAVVANSTKLVLALP
jgi:hypothetical protein